MKKDQPEQTKAFLNEQVRAARNRIPYFCMGPRYSDKEREQVRKQMVEAERERRRAALVEEARMKAEDKDEEFDEDSVEVPAHMVQHVKAEDYDPTVPWRRGCGWDITEIIEAIPIDGREHVHQCPKCGTKGTHRRVPLADLEESDGANL